MIPAVFAAFEYVKAQLSPLVRAKLQTRKGFYRTGIYADMTFSAGPVQGGSCLQWRVGQNRYQADSGSEAIGEEKTTFANPTHAGEMGGQFVGKESLQLIEIVRRRPRYRQGPEAFAG